MGRKDLHWLWAGSFLVDPKDIWGRGAGAGEEAERLGKGYPLTVLHFVTLPLKLIAAEKGPGLLPCADTPFQREFCHHVLCSGPLPQSQNPTFPKGVPTPQTQLLAREVVTQFHWVRPTDSSKSCYFPQLTDGLCTSR